MVYGSKGLHVSRPEVKPRAPSWPYVFDDAVFQSDTWKNVEDAAEFWKLYDRSRQPPGMSGTVLGARRHE